jgi:hypothetical protein
MESCLASRFLKCGDRIFAAFLEPFVTSLEHLVDVHGAGQLQDHRALAGSLDHLDAEPVAGRDPELAPRPGRKDHLPFGADGGRIWWARPQRFHECKIASLTSGGNEMIATLILAMTLLPAFPTAAPPAASPSDLERQRLIAHLDMTERWLSDEVGLLSPAQLAFRPGAGAWSILEVVDHLVVVGPIYWQDLQKALKSPARDPIWRERDAEILWYGIDRTDRQKAIAGEEPKGTLRDIRAGLEAFRKATAQLREFAKATTEDLRSHAVEREGCDAYQWALLISTHAQRHILQIREIKADRRFPTS